MNNLSWLLYLADFTSTVSSVLFDIGIWGLFLVFIWFFISCIFATVNIHYEPKNEMEHIRQFAGNMLVMAKRVPFYLFICITMMISSAFFPSKETMYLIAGSEIGQKVIQSEKVNGIIDSSLKLVQQKIDGEIEKMNIEKKESSKNK